jgi:hypothetical protein
VAGLQVPPALVSALHIPAINPVPTVAALASELSRPGHKKWLHQNGLDDDLARGAETIST